jgi:hypothetical protein
VDEHEIRVIGSTEALHAVMTVGQNLRSSGPEWRAGQNRSANVYVIEIAR